MINTTCSYCKKTFQVHLYRINEAKFCSKSCAAKSHTGDNHPRKRPTETRTCDHCKKEYFVNKNYDRNIRFCSLMCSAKHTFSGENQRKWKGGDHIFHCATCGKESTKRRGVSNGNAPKYCSRKCSNIGRNTMQEVKCPGCNKTIRVHPSWIEKGRQYCTISCYRRNRIKPNSIERAIQNGLTKHGISFIPEYPVMRYHIDIYIPSHQLAIECDGDYWHKGRESYDEQRNKKLQDAGIYVMRFSEKDIRSNPDICVQKILSFIDSH